ncbi:hypothetical protein [Pseudomonas sp. O230]|uniref:hypothetical protein n=1 Tax=Pseudomonas sp. O230 TaxID=3159450 RepID=UPI00387AA5DF
MKDNEKESNMNTDISKETFELSVDTETAEKFATLLNDESLMHAGFVAHQSNSDTIGLEDASKN